MANGADKKFVRNIAIAGSVVVLLLVIFALAQLKSRMGQTPTPTVSNPNQVESYQNGQLPPGLPENIILESGVKITQSFTATSPDGKVQSTVGFDSSNTVRENFDLYKNYLSKNGWKLVQTADDTADHKAILANNANGYLTVNISKGETESVESIVVISFLVIK